MPRRAAGDSRESATDGAPWRRAPSRAVAGQRHGVAWRRLARPAAAESAAITRGARGITQ